MKILSYLALMAMAITGTLCAQTNALSNTNASAVVNTNAVNQILALVTTNPPAANPPPRETVIEAVGPAVFHQVDHGLRVVYREHVRVTSPGLKLTCEWLAADFSQASGRVTNIVAETNVVINATDDKGREMHATGDKAVYAFIVENGVTNETVTLTGDARAEYKDITLTGNPIIWDRTHDSLYVPTNPKMIFHQNLETPAAGTNTTMGETNTPVIETNLPPLRTNQSAAPE